MRRRGRTAVVVLGNFGRSPRMQYHALSLALQANLQVDVVAYGGSDPHAAVLENPSIHIHRMKQWPTIPQNFPRFLRPFMLMLKRIIHYYSDPQILVFACIRPHQVESANEDMFGCCLPVCAVSYSCINELVEVDRNGLLFSSSSKLADEFMMLFRGFPDECEALKSLRVGVSERQSSARWAPGWAKNAQPLVSEVIFQNLSS